MRGVAVKCNCRWRGRRVPRECNCYEHCSCAPFGLCPKCGRRLYSVAQARADAESDAQVRRFLADVKAAEDVIVAAGLAKDGEVNETAYRLVGLGWQVDLTAEDAARLLAAQEDVR